MDVTGHQLFGKGQCKEKADEKIKTKESQVRLITHERFLGKSELLGNIVGSYFLQAKGRKAEDIIGFNVILRASKSATKRIEVYSYRAPAVPEQGTCWGKYGRLIRRCGIRTSGPRHSKPSGHLCLLRTK